jgi:hypothetical protein
MVWGQSRAVMITRTKDEPVVRTAYALYPSGGEWPDDWLDNPDNIALINDKGDVGLFETCSLMVYSGHYFFLSRGKEAVLTAKEMMALIFDKYRAEAIRGLVAEDHLASRWMARHLGFKSYGMVDTATKPHELFVMTRSEFENK